MYDTKILTLYKNYRGFSLLSIVGKVFTKICLRRLQVLAGRIYPESQCGFSAKRSTIDRISFRQLQEKCWKEQMLF